MNIRIIGKRIPSKAFDIEHIIFDVLKSPQPSMFQFIKTAVTTHYFTNEVLLSKLNSEELAIMQSLDKRIAGQSIKYQITKPLNLRDILPKYLGTQIDQAAYMGVKQRVCREALALVLLGEGNTQVIVEARAFLTLYRRHPTAYWYFASKEYWKHPVILVEQNTIFDGDLLGAITPISIENLSLPTTPNMVKSLKLVEGYRYE